jgi:hypothetical protein
LSSKLREYLYHQEREILAQMAALKSELAEVRIARGALESKSPMAPAQESPQSGKLRQRDMILKLLDDRPHGGRSDEIAGWVLSEYGVEIAPATMSSQLSRMKSEDGTVDNDTRTKIWRSKRHALSSAAVASDETEPEHPGGTAGEATPSPDSSDEWSV